MKYEKQLQKILYSLRKHFSQNITQKKQLTHLNLTDSFFSVVFLNLGFDFSRPTPLSVTEEGTSGSVTSGDKSGDEDTCICGTDILEDSFTKMASSSTQASVTCWFMSV